MEFEKGGSMGEVASDSALHKWVAVGFEVIGEEGQEAFTD